MVYDEGALNVGRLLECDSPPLLDDPPAYPESSIDSFPYMEAGIAGKVGWRLVVELNLPAPAYAPTPAAPAVMAPALATSSISSSSPPSPDRPVGCVCSGYNAARSSAVATISGQRIFSLASRLLRLFLRAERHRKRKRAKRASPPTTDPAMIPPRAPLLNPPLVLLLLFPREGVVSVVGASWEVKVWVPMTITGGGKTRRVGDKGEKVNMAPSRGSHAGEIKRVSRTGCWCNDYCRLGLRKDEQERGENES